MATVKLNAPRSRGEAEYAAGDDYTCSPAEAAQLVALGLATETKAPKATPIEAAAEVAPETAAEPKPKRR